MALVPDSLHAQVERYKRRAQRLTLAEGVAQTAGLFLGLLALTFLLDRWLFLPLAARVALTASVWTATLAGFIRFILLPLRKRWGNIEVAFNVEAAFPQLNEELATAVQLEASRDPDSIKGSPQLIEALVNDLAHRSGHLDFAAVLSPARARISAAVAAALALGFAVYAIAGTEHFLLLARRFANPLAALPRASSVKLQVKPGDATIETGGSVTVRVSVFNYRVGRASVFFADDGQPVIRLETLAADAPPPSAPSKPGAPVPLQQFEIPLPAIKSNAVYFVRAGDAESQPFRIVAQRGPRLERFTLTYHYPDYTTLPPKTVTAETADIAALRGTRVTVVATASQPLSGAWLEANGSPLKPAPITGDRNVTAEITVNHDAEFKLRVVDAVGFKNADAVSYQIKALTDQPPTVKLLDPEQDVEIGKPEPLELKFAATDDYGVASAYLVHNNQRDQMPVNGVATFDLARAGYKSGDEITFHIEVEDNSPDRQTARSEERKVRISELADLSLRNKDFTDLRKLREAITRAGQSITDARRGIEQLRADFGRTSQWSPDLVARANAFRRDLDAAHEAAAAAQMLAGVCATQPRTPQTLRDWENIINQIEQLDDQLAAALPAAAALDRDQASAAVMAPALARLADTTVVADKIAAQLAQGFTRLYDARETGVLSQLARRIDRAEQRVLEDVYGITRQWRRKRGANASDQASIVAATQLLAAGLGAVGAPLPQNTEPLRTARERLTGIAQPKIESFQQWLADKGNGHGWRNRESMDSLTEALHKTREDLARAETASSEAADTARGQFEHSRLDLSQRLLAASQAPAGELHDRMGDLITRVDRLSEPHLTQRAGDPRWGQDLLLVRDGLQSLATGTASQGPGSQLRQLGGQLNLLERQRDLRLLVRGLRQLELQQTVVSKGLDETVAWQRLRLGELADVERDVRAEFAPVGARLGALADRVAPVDGEAAREIQEARRQFDTSRTLSRLESAVSQAEAGDRTQAAERAREAQVEIAALRSTLERILKTRLQAAETARAQLQQHEPSPSERVDRLAQKQEALAKQTQQQPAPTPEERRQRAADQEQLRADARAVERSLLAHAPEQPTPEQMRDLHDAALRVAEAEREPMAAATEALARGQQPKALEQQQAAAQKLRQTAQQLAAAKKADQMVAQAGQAEALAKQQEKLLATTNASQPSALPAHAQEQRSLAAQAQALAQATQQASPAAASPMTAAQTAMQQAAQAMQSADKSTAASRQQTAMQQLQQAAQAMASVKQAAAAEAEQARSQLQQAEKDLPNQPQLAKGYDWLKKLGDIAAKQNDVAQRAAANQEASPLATQQSEVRQKMKSDLENEPSIRADQLQQALDKLRSGAQAVSELARKEQEMAGKLDQVRSERDWKQKDAQRHAEEVARQAQRAAQQNPAKAGDFQRQAQAMNNAAEALKRGDHEAARQQIEQNAKSSNDQGQDWIKTAQKARAEAGKDRRANAERTKEAGQTARAGQQMQSLSRQESELARKLAELTRNPVQQMDQLAGDQRQMSSELQRVGEDLGQTKAKLAELAPEVAKAMTDAPETAKDRIPEKMRGSADQMKSRNTQQAAQDTRAAQQALDRLADQLARAAGDASDKHPNIKIVPIGLEPATPPPHAASALEHAAGKMDQAKGEFEKGRTQPGQRPAAEAAQTLQSLMETSAQAQQQELIAAMQQMAAEQAAQQAAQQTPGQESQSLDSKMGSPGSGTTKGTPAELRPRGALVNLDKLPAELQQGLMHGMSEKYPPEYEQLIKKYFERLSKASGK